MFKRTGLVAGAIVLAAGAALSAPEAKREASATDVAKGKVARQVFDQLVARYRNAEGYDIDDLAFWSQRVLDAELAIATDAAERTKACQAHLDRTQEIEKIAASHFKVGQGTQTSALAAEYYRLDAESRLNAQKP